MLSFDASISGLRVAQYAIETIGSNITNATTEGYHRQEVIIKPINLRSSSKIPLGGAEVERVRRLVDDFLERQIIYQQGSMGQATGKLEILKAVESLFGQVGSGGLDTAMNRFFGSLSELSSQPESMPLRSQVAWSADALAGQFRNAASFLQDISVQVSQQISQYVDKHAER